MAMMGSSAHLILLALVLLAALLSSTAATSARQLPSRKQQIRGQRYPDSHQQRRGLGKDDKDEDNAEMESAFEDDKDKDAPPVDNILNGDNIVNNNNEEDPYNGFGEDYADQAEFNSLWFVDLPDMVIRMGVLVPSSTYRQANNDNNDNVAVEVLVKAFLEGAMAGYYKDARLVLLDASMSRSESYGQVSGGGSLVDVTITGEVGYQLDSKETKLPLATEEDMREDTIKFFESWKDDDLEKYLEKNGVLGAAVTQTFVDGTAVTGKGDKGDDKKPPKEDGVAKDANLENAEGGADAGLIVGLLLVFLCLIIVLILLYTVRDQIVSETSRCCSSCKEKFTNARQSRRGFRDFGKDDTNKDRSFSIDEGYPSDDQKRLNESTESSSQCSEESRKWFGLANMWQNRTIFRGAVNEDAEDDLRAGNQRKWFDVPKFFSRARSGREEPEDGVLNRIQVLVDDDHSLYAKKTYSKTSAARLRSMVSNQHSAATEPVSNIPINRRNGSSQRRRFERPQKFVASSEDVSPQKTVATIQSISPTRSYEDSIMQMDDSGQEYLESHVTPAKNKITTRTPSEIAQTWTSSTRASTYTDGVSPSTPAGLASSSSWQPTPPMPEVEEEPPIDFCTGMVGQTKKEDSSAKRAPEPPSSSWADSFAAFLNPCNPQISSIFREESDRLDNIVANLPRNKSVFDDAVNDTMESGEAESPRRAVQNDRRPRYNKSKYGSSRYESHHANHRQGDSYNNGNVRL